MKLTSKQEVFCNCIIDGMTQYEAYKTAYDAETMQRAQIDTEASLLIRNPKISQRLADFKKKVEERQLWSRERSVRVLGSIADEKETQSAARVSAVKELNAMHGYNEPKELAVNNVHSGPGGGPIENKWTVEVLE